MDEMGQTFIEHALKNGLQDARRVFATFAPDKQDLLDKWTAEYRQMTESVREGFPPKILSAPGRGEPWYPGPLRGDKRWPAFRSRVAARLASVPLEQLDASTSKVVAYTDNPKEAHYRTKGLVVGYVQSGKTTSFTGVAAKLADRGYKLIIVLSGIHNGLRLQTQERLQSELVHSAPAGSWFPLTDEHQDFQTPPTPAAAFLQNREGTLLVVVKKNRMVLTKLIRWLGIAARNGSFDSAPVAIIDDEADQASVATPKINPQIIRLIGMFPRCTYLGYTATPFANVLIDPKSDDLYPESFIVNLPEPDGYFGAERIFGRDALETEESGARLDGFDMIRIIPDDEASRVRPVGRGKEHGFTPQITGELESAIRYFVMATGARRARGDRRHSTMLIHPSMKTSVHEAFRTPVSQYVEVLIGGLFREDPALLESLRQQWASECGRVAADEFGNTAVPFEVVLEHLPAVLHKAKVVVDNFRSTDRLDYSGPDPEVAIAVGGNTLSRGLTLEGLVVSYFVRSAKTYDTLMQMGRWFGFRPGYEDLPRIWMTEGLRQDFRHLAMVEAEIRRDIERYEEQDLSPRDVGVRIQTHPVLNITAKMGSAVRTAQASYGSRRVQTRYFREDDAAWLKTNAEAARGLVADALSDGAALEHKGDGTVILRDVEVGRVLSFLETYRVHPDSPDLEPKLVTSYIRKEVGRRVRPSLLAWNVAVVGGPITDPAHEFVFSEDVAVGTVARSKVKGTGGSKADIKTLMSKDHIVVDMNITPAQARALSESKLKAMRDDPGYADHGLLLLFPIARDSQPDPANVLLREQLEACEHVIGMALVFPGSEDVVANKYVEVDTSGVDDSEYDEVDAAIEGDDFGAESA